MPQPQRESQKDSEGELFRLLVENIKDYAIFVTDQQGRVQSWNPGAERLLGYREEEIVGQPADIFFTPEDVRSGVPQRERQAAVEEGRGNDDRWHVRKDGSRFWAGGMMTPLWDDDHKLRGFAKIMRDRTEWKLREVAAEEQDRLAAFSKDVGLALIQTDTLPGMLRRCAEAMVRHLNGAFARIWTLNAAENVLELRASAGLYTHLDGSHSRVPVGKYKIGLIAQERQPHLTNAVVGDPRVGDQPWAEREGMVAFAGYPLVVDGRSVGVMAMFARHPLTEATLGAMAAVANAIAVGIERKAAEEEGRRQREWLSVTLASIGDAVIATDTGGRVTFLNPVAQALTGWALADAQGQPLEVVFPIVNEQSRQPVENPVAKVLQAGKVVGLANHTILIGKDGTERPIDDSAAPIRDEQGGLRGVVLVFRDISDQKRAEAEVRRAGEQARTILESITDAFCALDRDWQFVYVNRQAEVLLGRSRDDLLGRDLWQEYPATVGTEVDRNYRRAVSENVAVTFEFYFPPHDRWYEVNAYPSGDGLSVYFRDIGKRKGAEAALRVSEARKSAILETALDCIITMDHEGKVVEFNPAAEKTFGYSRAEVIGQELGSLIVPLRMRKAHQKGMAHYLETGEGPVLGKRLELPALRADGTEFPVELAITLIPTDGPPLFTAYLRDISERKRAEEALLDAHRQLEDRVAARTAELVRANEFLKALLENVQTGVVACDAAGVLTLFNGVTRALHGLPEEPIPPDQWAARYRLYRPDGQTPMATDEVPLYRALQGERVQDAEMVIAPADTPPRTVLTSGQAFFDAQGEKLGAVVSMQDITARKQAEAALRQAHDELEGRVEERTEELGRANAALKESEEKLRLLADTIPQLAWMARTDGDIFWYNRRWYEYTGTTPEQMEGWGWQSVHDPEVLPKVLERWKASIATGEPFDMVFPLKGADEEFRPFLTRVNPLRDEEGRILYWFGTNTDISDIKRMEEALRDADRRKDEFLATLAHELRNPLAPVRNALQILKMPRVDAGTVERSRDMMERQVHHLVRLVDDLLDVSRVMRGKIELRRERVELATVVARAVETMQPLIDAQGHQLSVRLPSESLPIDADPVRLAQVVGNLLTNAAKYTEAGGRIWLTAERSGDVAVLRVRDTGIGIDPAMLPRIFELFVQVDHASTKAQGGLGIGLTLVKNLVETHNGTVEARSEGLGLGSEFVVRLPTSAQVVDPDQGGEPGQQVSQSPAASGHRLLVVDDNQDGADSLATLLKLQGHEVRVAYSGMAALETTKTYTPDVVFMDIGMPGMDGYEVARRLRQTPGLERVVLAALTGWGQQEDRRRTADAGFDHHLVKPPEPKAVENILADLPKRV
ncbi:MAG: PAS domain S-box protein [Acidobacteria bacterium]|nr:PAS domain S-box protein [Acidobacteriota bacterium]